MTDTDLAVMTNNKSTPHHSCQNPEPWLRLARVPGMGSRTLLKLLSYLKTPENILGASQQQLRQYVTLTARSLHVMMNPDQGALKTDLEWLDSADHHLLSFLDPLYPKLLQQITDPPPMLFCSGQLVTLEQPQIAIVGSRNPDHYGLDSAFNFAKDLCNKGLSITSGLALGIDAAAHQGAIAAKGDTIAVAATGLDRVYPARHKNLARDICKNGLIISEYPLGTPPLAHRFPRRNRIISGLSLGTFVVQGALQSGSLITAKLALEQNREVFALPGSIHNPLSKGCHQLIRQGAKMVETTQDLLFELAPQLQSLLESSNLSHTPSKNHGSEGKNQQMEAGQSLTDRQKQLLNLIGYEPVSIDTLVERSDWGSDAVASVVLELELLGLLQSTAGAYLRK